MFLKSNLSKTRLSFEFQDCHLYTGACNNRYIPYLYFLGCKHISILNKKPNHWPQIKVLGPENLNSNCLRTLLQAITVGNTFPNKRAVGITCSHVHCEFPEPQLYVDRCMSKYTRYIYFDIYIYTPRTQTSLVSIGKDLLLEATQRTNGFQAYIHTLPILLMAEILHQFICSFSHYLQGFIMFYTCQVVQDVFHEQYHKDYLVRTYFQWQHESNRALER